MSLVTTRAIGTTRTIAAPRLADLHVVWAGSFLLLLPNVLFALTLQPAAAAVLLAGAAGTLALLPRRATGTVLARALDLPRLGLCLALALALLIIGGEGHLVFANWDWLWRDAVLADLVRSPFPPTYQVAGDTMFLRAPLGMYMLPALVAKATSLAVGHAVLVAQNAALLGLVLYLLAAIAGRRAALALVVFLSFSGLDVVGQLIMWVKQGHPLAAFVLPSHIEDWTLFQYSSVATQLFWVPNHALPSYWLALLALLCARREIALPEVGPALAASLFWSPFAFIGALPFAAALFVRDARATLAAPRFWGAAVSALCFLPVALYMKVDAAQVPHAFILFYPLMAFTIALFLIVEVPHVFVIRHVWAELEPSLRLMLCVALAVLLVLPTILLGYSGDLVMRASIPALTILAIAFAEALALASRSRPTLLLAGLILMGLGAVTPAQEVLRALTLHRFAISDCNLLTVWKKVGTRQPTLENYLARASLMPTWMARPAERGATPLVNRPDTVCWPDLPFDPAMSIIRNSTDQLASPATPWRPL